MELSLTCRTAREGIGAQLVRIGGDMIGFRHCDPRFPFLWQESWQPEARWHAAGEGPVNYFADTPVGAWAEFLRHEAIQDAEDLKGVRRSLWAVELPDDDYAVPNLPDAILKGGRRTYEACQAEAKRLRKAGALRLQTPSAALGRGGASGWTSSPQLQPATPPREGGVWILFGPNQNLVGWPAVEAGAPPERILPLVNHL